MLSHRRFSRPVLSTTQPSLRVRSSAVKPQTQVISYHGKGALSTKRTAPQEKNKKIENWGLQNEKRYAIITKLSGRQQNIRVWRSLVSRLNGVQEALSSNLNTRTILTKRYRCVWRKARRINRFRTFSSPDFFSHTIDANRCFRASAPIRTGCFPVSCRCVQPAPFFSGDFSGWQRYFSQKRITKIWALFCWS